MEEEQQFGVILSLPTVTYTTTKKCQGPPELKGQEGAYSADTLQKPDPANTDLGLMTCRTAGEERWPSVLMGCVHVPLALSCS